MSEPIKTREWNYEEILKVQEDLPLSITHALAARCQDYEDRIAELEARERGDRAAYEMLELALKNANCERDEAREATRECYSWFFRCDPSSGPYLEDMKDRWPWLEDTDESK